MQTDQMTSFSHFWLYLGIFTCLFMQTYRTFTYPYCMTCPRTFTRTCSVQINRLWGLLKQLEYLNPQITFGGTTDKLIHFMMMTNFTFVFWRLWIVITKTSPSLWSLNSNFWKVKDLMWPHNIILKVRLKFQSLPFIYLIMVYLTVLSMPQLYSMEWDEDQWLMNGKRCKRKQAV